LCGDASVLPAPDQERTWCGGAGVGAKPCGGVNPFFDGDDYLNLSVVGLRQEWVPAAAELKLLHHLEP
jgi:hypothetical protein